MTYKIGSFFAVLFFFLVGDTTLVLPLLTGFSLFWAAAFALIVESPYFLLSRKRMSRYQDAILAISRVNKREKESEALQLIEKLSQQQEEDRQREEVDGEDAGEKSARRRQEGLAVYRTIALASVLMMNAGIGDYLSMLTISRLSNLPIYQNSVIALSVDLSAFVLLVFVSQRVERKRTTQAVCVILLACAALLLWIGPISKSALANAATGLLSFAMKFFISCNVALLYSYLGELVPTRYRGKAIGIGNIFLKTAGSLASQFESLSSTWNVQPMVFAATLCVPSLVACHFLRETLNKSIQE